MNISVQTNKNIIFFEVLLSLLKTEKEKYHPLGEKTLKEYEYVRKLKSYKEFEDKYNQKEIPSHQYQYLFLSVHLNDNLTPKTLSPNDGFGPNRVKGYKEMIYPLVKAIAQESNFDDIYVRKILSDYEKVTKEFQKLFDKQKPGETLMNFWKGEYKPKLVFIPDPLRVGGGSGASRKNTLYSITGTVIDKEEIIFKPSHMISNLLHEYSHSLFKYYIYSNKDIFKKNKEICEVLSKKIEGKVGEMVLKNYGTSSNYFEETFIRAVQILLSKKFFTKYVEEEEIEEKTRKQLENRRKDGFIYIEDFYKELEKERDPIDLYMKVLESLKNS
jgi:hypothetical protein